MNSIGTKKNVVNSKKTQTVVPIKGIQEPKGKAMAMAEIGQKAASRGIQPSQTVVSMKGTRDSKRKAMTMAEIGQKAMSRGIQPGQMDKAGLIHSIQRAEGNTPCFGTTSNGQCHYTDCCFMADCLEV
ncbi:MAG: hypothetical protein WAK60_05435 [Sedimentisphaerales bacterium]